MALKCVVCGKPGSGAFCARCQKPPPPPPQLCSDCGNRPVWWLHDQLCRSCAVKGGDRSDRMLVDVDEVVTYFDGDRAKATAFLQRVRHRTDQ